MGAESRQGVPGWKGLTMGAESREGWMQVTSRPRGGCGRG
jgi:hypothetical protein